MANFDNCLLQATGIGTLTEKEIRQILYPELEGVVELVQIISSSKEDETSALIQFTDHRAAAKALALKDGTPYYSGGVTKHLHLVWYEPQVSYHTSNGSRSEVVETNKEKVTRREKHHYGIKRHTPDRPDEHQHREHRPSCKVPIEKISQVTDNVQPLRSHCRTGPSTTTQSSDHTEIRLKPFPSTQLPRLAKLSSILTEEVEPGDVYVDLTSKDNSRKRQRESPEPPFEDDEKQDSGSTSGCQPQRKVMPKELYETVRQQWMERLKACEEQESMKKRRMRFDIPPEAPGPHKAATTKLPHASSKPKPKPKPKPTPKAQPKPKPTAKSVQHSHKPVPMYDRQRPIPLHPHQQQCSRSKGTSGGEKRTCVLEDDQWDAVPRGEVSFIDLDETASSPDYFDYVPNISSSDRYVTGYRVFLRTSSPSPSESNSSISQVTSYSSAADMGISVPTVHRSSFDQHRRCRPKDGNRYPPKRSGRRQVYV